MSATNERDLPQFSHGYLQPSAQSQFGTTRIVTGKQVSPLMKAISARLKPKLKTARKPSTKIRVKTKGIKADDKVRLVNDSTAHSRFF